MSIVTCRSHRATKIPKRLEQRNTEFGFSYVGGTSGPWRVVESLTRCGFPLRAATHIQIMPGSLVRVPFGTSWILSGVVRNSRYVAREELNPFESNRTSFCGGEATCAALVAIRKSAAWWNLARDDRSQIVEARAGKLATAMKFLPAIARRLQHGRDLGEKFDFVTWFEYAPQDARIFDDMIAALRSSEEWKYVEREIDIRLAAEFQ